MLPEEYRDDLVQLRTEGWYFLTTRNYDQEAQSPESALDLEQREAEFEAIKEKILQVVLPGLVPVQQEIIREHFLKR